VTPSIHQVFADRSPSFQGSNRRNVGKRSELARYSDEAWCDGRNESQPRTMEKRCLPPDLIRSPRDRCGALLVAAIRGSGLPGSTTRLSWSLTLRNVSIGEANCSLQSTKRIAGNRPKPDGASLCLKVVDGSVGDADLVPLNVYYCVLDAISRHNKLALMPIFQAALQQ
jgi:hypothetical protein